MENLELDNKIARFKADVEALVKKHAAMYRIEYDPFGEGDGEAPPEYIIVLDGEETYLTLTDLMPRKLLH